MDLLPLLANSVSRSVLSSDRTAMIMKQTKKV